MQSYIQWKGDNQKEIESFVGHAVTVADGLLTYKRFRPVYVMDAPPEIEISQDVQPTDYVLSKEFTLVTIQVSDYIEKTKFGVLIAFEKDRFERNLEFITKRYPDYYVND